MTHAMELVSPQKQNLLRAMPNSLVMMMDAGWSLDWVQRQPLIVLVTQLGLASLKDLHLCSVKCHSVVLIVEFCSLGLLGGIPNLYFQCYQSSPRKCS